MCEPCINKNKLDSGDNMPTKSEKASEFIERIKENLKIGAFEVKNENGHVLLTKDQIKKIYTFVLENIDVEKVSAIGAPHSENYGLRFEKNITKGLPRTICIVKNAHTDEFELIVMPNSKLSTDEKIKIQKARGSSKVYKQAYRIDIKHPIVVKARLQVTFGGWTPATMEKIINGVKISQLIHSNFIDKTYMGPKYIHKSKQLNRSYNAVYVFADKADADLASVVNKAKYYAGGIEPLALKNICHDLCGDVLQGLIDIHKRGRVHIDIKPQNILVY